MRKMVQTYPSYDEANDAQITLLAAGIDCLVTRHTQGVWDIAEGSNEIYGVEVEEADFERSEELLSKRIADGYEPLFKCPVCNGSNAKRYSFYDSGWFVFTWILIFPVFWSMYRMKRDGRRYKCLDCERLYRIKL